MTHPVPQFGPAFVAALQTLGAADEAEIEVTVVAAERDFDDKIERARFPHQDDRVDTSFDPFDAIFPDVHTLRALGLDLEPLAGCLELEKISPEFVAVLVKRVQKKQVSANDANLALWRVNSSINVRSLHRDLHLLGVLGFDVDSLAVVLNAGRMNGTGARSLVHRVCIGGLSIADANSGLGNIAESVVEEQQSRRAA